MIIDKDGTMLQVQRVFAAPLDEVFAAWTQPEILKQWWGPPGTTTPFIEMDLQVGGRYRFGMQYEAGDIFYVGGVYREVQPPERIVFTWRWEQPEMDFGESQVTIEFCERDNGTEVTLKHEGFPNEEACRAHDEGWRNFYDKFGERIVPND